MAEQGLLPVYLMNGADEFKREFLVERLTKRIAKLGDLDFNKDVFVAGAVDAGQLVAACNTLPFACDYRLVIVKDADKLAKSVSEELVAYLQDPCQTTVLALTATKLAKNTRLYKAVAKVSPKAVVDCAPKSRRELPTQVRDFGASEGITVTQAAAEQLIAYVGESTVRLDTELKKLAAALGKGAVVDVAQIDRYVTRTAEVKPWDFTDALAARDARKALQLFSRMGGQPPFGLLTMSVNRIRELLVAKDVAQTGGGTRDLARELGVPDWRVKNHMRWASRFSEHELVQALAGAADAERAMKSGTDPVTEFERWVLRTCAQG